METVHQKQQYSVVSIQVGKPATVNHGNKEVSTGIFKHPVTGVQRLTVNGLPGDGQADLVNHGGPDKAVCVYFSNHYPHWEKTLGTKLDNGAFGENFTISEGCEPEIAVGDIFEIGNALVQVSQPRLPCFKLGLKHAEPKLPEWVLETGFTGFYLRVLEEGEVEAGDKLTLVRKHPAKISIAEATAIMMKDKNNLVRARRLLAIDELSESWRETLIKRVEQLAKHENHS